MGLSVNLEYLAEEFRDLLEKFQIESNDYTYVLNSYYKICERSRIGNKTATMTLYPDLTEAEYYRNYKGKPVILDCDQIGDDLSFLAEYHSYLTLLWESAEMENRSYAETVYLIGNIEGRLMYNHATEDDMELIALWKEEMTGG